VDQVSFEVERGEVVGLLGPNGAGKTTIMRILAGYLPASSGSVQVAGFDVLRQSLEVRRRIGYLPESVPLYPELRVQEMLAFQARLHGLSRKEARQRIPAVLERVGVADRSRSLVGQLSRGLRQRVGLAVALLPRPEVLILDEPTSGLDPLQRIEVRKLVMELASEHTLLLSSHILPEIEAVCPRLVILARGAVAADGTREALVRERTGGAHVRLEAFVGDGAEAARLLSSLAGVEKVTSEGRLGIHEQFKIRCREDLREDVGALAMTRGWAVRELSWRQPSLEELFARIALELEPDLPMESAAPSQDVGGKPQSGLLSLAAGGPGDAAPVEQASKPVYNLNPFDRGAGRDLGAPEDAPAPEATGGGGGFQGLSPFQRPAPEQAADEDAGEDTSQAQEGGPSS